MDDSTIPSLDPDGAQRQLAAARAASVVVLAGGMIVPGPEAEMVAAAAANQGLASYVVGWRRARPEELVAHYRGLWDGAELEGTGEPWWWRQRHPSGVGLLSQHDEPMRAYAARWEEARRTASTA